MEIHMKLLTLRKSHAMSQEDMAKALYVSRQTIYKWESGRALPDIEKLRQICLLFDVSADEMLDIGDAVGRASGGKAEKPPAANKGSKLRWLKYILAFCLTAALIVAAAALLHRRPAEVQSAIELNIVPVELQGDLNASVSERDFLRLLQNVARTRNKAVTGLDAAADTATNEQLTREKAAYWVYCTQIWTMLDGSAELSCETDTGIKALSGRNVYGDLNLISRSAADGEQPWEWRLASELAETGRLHLSYDGTAEAETKINGILDGRYYTSVVFCTAQRSYLTETTLMESRNGSFRPKDKLTCREAVLAAYRLYGSW